MMDAFIVHSSLAIPCTQHIRYKSTEFISPTVQTLISINMNYMLSFTTFLLIAASVEIQAFTTPHHRSLHTTGTSSSPKLLLNKTTKYQQKQQHHQNQYQQYNPRKTGTHLSAEDESSSNNEVFLSLSKSDQTVVGGIGIVTSTIMLWSEYVLKTTGCGLPAGPFGLLGAAEGLSYLGVIGLVSFSILTKIKTVSTHYEYEYEYEYNQ
jgi:hypothetical protein